jgi:transcription initiation factor TFIIH subunit 3
MQSNFYFQSVLLDACVIGEDSNLLQQGCDITGGIYIKIPQPSGLLEYLLASLQIN